MPTQTAATVKKLVLIDGNSLLYRGFFAMRALTTSDGQPTNAVFSFTMMLLTLINDQKPDAIIAAWDAPAKTFRHDEFSDYKGHRDAPPPELTSQKQLAYDMLDAFNIPMLEAPGWEADDIIGTLARQGRDTGYEVLIVTGDLDALQLVEPGVRVMTTVKGVSDTVLYDDAAVMTRYGLRPDQLADYRALKGDTSDNIPGVPGIGEKTASALLQQYDTVENVLSHAEEVKQNKVRNALIEYTEQAKLSKRLAIIVRDVPIADKISIPALDDENRVPDWSQVRDLFERLEFRALLNRLPKEIGGKPKENNISVATKSGSTDRLESDEYDPFAEPNADADEPIVETPSVVVALDYRLADTDEKLAEAVGAAHWADAIGLRLHTFGDGVDARIIGLAIGVGDGVVHYIPIGKTAAAADDTSTVTTLFDNGAEQIESVEPMPLPDALIELLQSAESRKVTHDAKSAESLLLGHGVVLNGVVFDTEIAAYLLNAGRRSGYPLQEIAKDFASRILTIPEKKTAQRWEQIAAEADALLALQNVLLPRLERDNQVSVMERFELPIAPILAKMERAGVAVDTTVLNRLTVEFDARIAVLEREIFEIAGVSFSVGSPKQLGEILFEKLKIPAGKKTKTGYSTGADVLEELAPEYPIIGLVQEHRALTKLKNTYAESLPTLVNPHTHRIHTTLTQTVAATGRLSSSNPNLQNIPIRTAIGREIRRAFIAAPGRILVSADYSQIELRIFAHCSKDAELLAAFRGAEDIHKYTAGKIYGVPVAEVTNDMRRAAKTVNYAVIYGISDFVLARRLGISMAESKELKTSYFARFPGVRNYIDETVQFARDTGYVQTIFGRRRYMPDISSRVYQFRQASERAAANMPIQGAAADIMKLAMISVDTMLQKEKFKTVLLLQVHDELLFEAPPDEVSALIPRVRSCMADAYLLDVALDVEVKTGNTWADVTPVAETETVIGE